MSYLDYEFFCSVFMAYVKSSNKDMEPTALQVPRLMITPCFFMTSISPHQPNNSAPHILGRRKGGGGVDGNKHICSDGTFVASAHARLTPPSSIVSGIHPHIQRDISPWTLIAGGSLSC